MVRILDINDLSTHSRHVDQIKFQEPVDKNETNDSISIDRLKAAYLEGNPIHVDFPSVQSHNTTPTLIIPQPTTNTSADTPNVSENKLRTTRSGRRIFKDIKILSVRILCQRKAGRDSYKPPASNSQPHHDPNGRKIKSDSKRTSGFTSMPPTKTSPESSKVQNPEESNIAVVVLMTNGITVKIPVSATPSYSNCAMDNRKTNHNISITDHTLNVNIFEPRKPSQVCLTAHGFPQIMKKTKFTTNLGNKRLERVTHTQTRQFVKIRSLLGTRQQGVPVILRELVLPGGFYLVSPSFTVTDVTTE
ncbi:unnamed protein product, partial [Schistosoma margrebowiei]